MLFQGINSKNDLRLKNVKLPRSTASFGPGFADKLSFEERFHLLLFFIFIQNIFLCRRFEGNLLPLCQFQPKSI